MKQALSTDTLVKKSPELKQAPLLDVQELKFTRLVSQGVSLTTAYRQAFPHKNKLSYDTIRRYASELYAKDYIKSEVETSREKQATLARLAEDRIEQILITDDSEAKGSKVAEVAMFMYDHANGKATQRIESKQAHVVVTYNLGGSEAPPIPDEVLAQLNN